eukprot:m.36081 g.36081  ORF g.36081 m.36081 type:complete len:57 (-) comp9017_c0_seq1:754-924(-)
MQSNFLEIGWSHSLPCRSDSWKPYGFSDFNSPEGKSKFTRQDGWNRDAYCSAKQTY